MNDTRHLDLHLNRQRGDVGDKNFAADFDSRRDKKSDGSLVPALRPVRHACGYDFSGDCPRHAVGNFRSTCARLRNRCRVVRRKFVQGRSNLLLGRVRRRNVHIKKSPVKIFGGIFFCAGKNFVRRIFFCGQQFLRTFVENLARDNFCCYNPQRILTR